MQLLIDGLKGLTSITQLYNSEIALTILATVLVVYGDVLNKHIKRMISPYHFIVRTIIFVLVCAFGYGLLVVFATPFVNQLLMMIPYMYRGLSIIVIFLVLGYLAEHRRYI
ncbi:DUF3392 family protein [Paraglaciecola aquimarina]|uniref:DUF3392 family protein n=1 Tax=Paraglaciecola aquimarina TaxID=1235557 RepID=A0ABU3SYY7_9ALTE|nr:DUF3392 family protein [Paraglaciecola aquimarina]MDU0355226.1 DUF3392 family protein [Paraglaciecola aquimarina]